jgi:transcriptional regulator with XRE-family HTH domain
MIVMEEVNKAFGELLASLRKEAGLTQQEFAQKVGMSRSAIANIESGKQGVVLTSIFAFANALSKSPTELIPLVTLESKIKSVVTEDINRDLLLSLANSGLQGKQP